jgi:hypothetical protein
MSWGARRREERAREKWEPPARCPLDGECLSKVRPPLNREICECGEPAVVLIVGMAGKKTPLCDSKWRRT